MCMRACEGCINRSANVYTLETPGNVERIVVDRRVVVEVAS